MTKSLTHRPLLDKNILLFLLFLTYSFLTLSQKNINKDERLADAYHYKDQFSRALIYYKRAWKTQTKTQIAKRIVSCYEQLRDFESCLKWQQIILERKYPTETDSIKFLSILQNLGKYKLIKQRVNLYHKNTENILIKRIKLSVDSIDLWKKRNEYKLTNCKHINTEFSENSPTIYNQGIVFSSNRTNLTSSKVYALDNHSFLDLYESKGIGSNLNKPTPFSSKINSDGHEGAISFNNDFSVAYFTRSESSQRKNDQKSDRNRLKLYKSEKNTLGWSSPAPFLLNDSAISFTHPFISTDEQLFFFSSNMRGGYGGFDLYFCVKISEEKWSSPINLGPEVNTEGNEMYPNYNEDSFLITFSSDTHAGMGGYDLFKATFKNNKWTNVINYGAPINSSYDDISISWNNSKKSGYLCSNRPEGSGGFDIYYLSKN